MTKLNDELKQQIADIKGMLFKNIQMIVDYAKAPHDDKPLTVEQFNKLVFRTDLLAKCVKDAEEVTEGKKE